jgi:Domain of unknown function (DUF3854)
MRCGCTTPAREAALPSARFSGIADEHASQREHTGPGPALRFLLSAIYKNFLVPEHLADLRKSGLPDETIALQKIRTVPPGMIDQFLGFEAPKIQHAYLIPFADPRGGWMQHVRLKVFPSLTTDSGTIKYLQPKHSGVRMFFPLAMLDGILHSLEPLYIVEGEKKALSAGQTGMPAIGICGIEGWHVGRSQDFHPDFDDVGPGGRIVKVIPDGDYRTLNERLHEDVERAAGT